MLPWPWECRYLFYVLFSFSLDEYQEVVMLNPIVVLLLMFWGTSILFSTVAAPIHIPPTVHKGSVFSTSSPTFVISCLFDDGYFNRCEVVSHCGFDLHFPDDLWCWIPFHVPVGHLYVFFGKIPSQVVCPLFNQIVYFFLLWSCMNSLHILDINPLWDISFANIFLIH